MPKTLLGISSLMLALATILGVLNTVKAKKLQTDLTTRAIAGDAAQRGRVQEQQAKGPSVSVPETTKNPDTENKAAKFEADLAQVLQQKADLQTKLQASQAEIESLRNRTPEASTEATTLNPGAPSPAEMQAQLDDARHQLESAERENAFLSERLGTTGGFATARERPGAELEKKRREVGGAKAGLHGTVLAVNRAYNFVVLNLGGRQGLEPNSRMIVSREGTIVGKIRISSVEPATAIGDVLVNSLGRGVQVQPGDTVTYASNNR